MSVERAHELWSRYLFEGTLIPDEEHELQAALREHPELADQLAGDLELDGLLRGLPERPAEADAAAKRFLDGVAAEIDGERFVNQVFSQIQAEAPPKPPPTRRRTRRGTLRASAAPAVSIPWRDLAVAAALLIGVLLALHQMRPTPAAPAPRPEPELVRPPQPKEPPTPPPPPEPVPPPAIPDPPPPAPPSESPVPAPPKPEPPPPPKPAPAAPRPPDRVDPPPPVSLTAVAILERVEGDPAAKNGDPIAAGATMETAAGKGLAVLRFPDGTRLELGPDTQLRELAAKGRRGLLVRGALLAEVPRQPAEQPLVLATPHGELRVPGSAFRLEVGKLTRLEVKEGKVRLKRADGKQVDVGANQSAQMAPGVEFAVKPIERRILYQADFEGAATGWDQGALDRSQTWNGSKGALKAAFRPNKDYAVHATMITSPTAPGWAFGEKTVLSFAYYLSAPVELKVQFRADKKQAIGWIVERPVAREWTVLSVRLVDVFRVRAGLGELVKPVFAELDDLQFHAGDDGKPVDLFLDSIILSEGGP